MNLNEKLDNISSYPFHMPGHKRNKKFNIISSNIDITEIDGFDNLHSPKGCLKDLENKYQNLYKSKKSILSVNGSTCGILAAISSVCDFCDKIIIARNCHKSVYNACYIKKLKVEYILPSVNDEFGNFNAITQSDIDKALKANPDAKAIVITSPTYEGVVSDVISPIPLIIDAAHGAHFGFNDKLPKYPNADIVISSLHKTLPALTQTAIINIYNDRFIKSIKKYMDIYESSSPSYVLMNSIDICANFLENSSKAFDNLCNNCIELISKINKNLSIFKVLNCDDITRLCIKCLKLNGNDFADILRNDYNIEVEMSCEKYVIFIITVGDEKSAFDMLYNALHDINLKYAKKENIMFSKIDSLTLPIKQYECYEIKNYEETNIENATGKICGEYIYAYPPGIPIIVPGEIISDDIIKYISNAIKSGTNIIGENGILKHKILTKC